MEKEKLTIHARRRLHFALGVALCASLLLSGMAAAQMPFYIVKGKVTADSENGPAVSGRMVAFYKDDINKKATATTDQNGNYEINVYDLWYNYDIPITLGLANTYKIAVPTIENGDYANYATEQFITLSSQAGYMEQNLVIIQSVLAPAGTIPLTIGREGNHVKISWNPGFQNPQIFVLTGNGDGQFTNDGEGWKPYADLVAQNPNKFDLQVGYLLHKNEVGTGAPEVYYKCLQAGFLKGAANGTFPNKSNLAAALAVGKVNVEAFKVENSAWNFIATPVYNASLNDTFGTNFTQGDQLWMWDDANQKFFSPATFSGNTWGNANNFVRGKGVLFNLAGSSPKMITLIGQVNIESFSRNISVKAQTPSYGWNVIGDPFPMVSAMEGFVNNMSVQGDSLWEWNNSQQKFLAPLTFDGANWPVNTKIKIGRAYGYNHVGNGFTWGIPAK